MSVTYTLSREVVIREIIIIKPYHSHPLNDNYIKFQRGIVYIAHPVRSCPGDGGLTPIVDEEIELNR